MPTSPPLPAPSLPCGAAPAALFDLRGRTALVTGASRGLGLCMAQALAAHGASVWLNGRDAAALALAVAQVEAHAAQGSVVRALPFDVTDTVSRQAALAKVKQVSGRLDVLVNNAGLRDRRPFTQLDAPALRTHARDRTWWPRSSCAVPPLRLMPQPGGRIVNITSIAGPIARAGRCSLHQQPKAGWQPSPVRIGRRAGATGHQRQRRGTRLLRHRSQCGHDHR
jgi:gluconate 5-dehydrogenase